jgi:hypothetical protein
MFCPQCKAEYRQGFTRCADCEVELVDEMPAGAIVAAEAAEAGGPADDPFCSFWKGDDPRLHLEICQLLDQEGIAHKTVRREERLFSFSNKQAFQIGVPYSQFERAEAVVQKAYGSGDDEAVPEATEEEPSPLALPESTGPDLLGKFAGTGHWYPEDASVEVWSSAYLHPGEIVAMSLKENLIQHRFDRAEGKNAIFVLPGDEERAREIVREVVEGVPPE